MTHIVLIGGTSHVGKSTLAAELGQRLGWTVLSTDQLARHPGRPWPVVPPHVAEHYRRLSADAIFQFLLAHHANLWPALRERIERQLRADGDPLVLEGSALRPELVSKLGGAAVEAVWLTADDRVVRERIRAASGYARAPAQVRELVDRFIERSVRDNARIVEQLDRLGLPRVDSGSPGAMDRFVREILGRLGAGRSLAVEPRPGMDLDEEAARAQLEAREPIFHRPELGTSRADLERMTDPQFWEVGASGRRYDREHCIATVLERQSAGHGIAPGSSVPPRDAARSAQRDDWWQASDFRCQRLARDLYLLTYTLVQPGHRITRRATIWRRAEEGWQAVYHQGTEVQG